MSNSERDTDHGNKIAREGCDRCVCGNKYWEYDRCIDCGLDIASLRFGYRHFGGLMVEIGLN